MGQAGPRSRREIPPGQGGNGRTPTSIDQETTPWNRAPAADRPGPSSSPAARASWGASSWRACIADGPRRPGRQPRASASDGRRARRWSTRYRRPRVRPGASRRRPRRGVDIDRPRRRRARRATTSRPSNLVAGRGAGRRCGTSSTSRSSGDESGPRRQCRRPRDRPGLARRAIRGKSPPPPRRGVPDARLRHRGRRRGPGSMDASQSGRHERCREPACVVDHRRRSDLPEHAAIAQDPPRGVAGDPPARPHREPRGRARPRTGSPPRRLRRARDVVVLDSLAPAERVAFVLHDVFAVPYEEIAPIVGRTPTAARQLASRARRRVQGAPCPTPISTASGPSSRRSSPRRATATSSASSPSSIRGSWSVRRGAARPS